MIEDIFEFVKFIDCLGIFLVIDFEKVFDLLNCCFFFKVLEKFNFGLYFLEWIKIFYFNIFSWVLNNGFIMDLFLVRGGVR